MRQKTRTAMRRREVLWAIAFLAPTLIVIITLRVWPIVGATVSSMHFGLPGGLAAAEWVGLQNYVDLFTDAAFLATIWRTIVFNLIINPLQVILALFLAVLLVQRVGGARYWRLLMFIPSLIPIVGSSVAWAIALRPDGPVNLLLGAVGIGPQPFFTSPSQAMASIILVASWVGIGYWMIFLIAGLNAIPLEYYEAARIDRAGPIRTFVSVTIPLLKRPLLFVIVATTIANFVLFVPIQALTNGGPESSTTVLMFEAFRTSFTYGDRYTGSAQVMLLTVVMLICVALQFRLLREEDDKR